MRLCYNESNFWEETTEELTSNFPSELGVTDIHDKAKIGTDF